MELIADRGDPLRVPAVPAEELRGDIEPRLEHF
jgi:hypothetical protein